MRKGALAHPGNRLAQDVDLRHQLIRPAIEQVYIQRREAAQAGCLGSARKSRRGHNR